MKATQTSRIFSQTTQSRGRRLLLQLVLPRAAAQEVPARTAEQPVAARTAEQPVAAAAAAERVLAGLALQRVVAGQSQQAVAAGRADQDVLADRADPVDEIAAAEHALIRSRIGGVAARRRARAWMVEWPGRAARVGVEVGVPLVDRRAA